MNKIQILGLCISVLGVLGLSYVPNQEPTQSHLIGFICAFLCVIGWSSEAVICGYSMKKSQISDEQALQIRQATSAIFYAIIILPIVSGWSFSVDIVFSSVTIIIGIAAIFGTISYIMYYRSIFKIGSGKAMALNITYTAWSVIFSVLLLGNSINIFTIMFGFLVIFGSLVATRTSDN